MDPNGQPSLDNIYLAGYGGGEKLLLWQRGEELPADPYEIDSYTGDAPSWTTGGTIFMAGTETDDPEFTRQMAAHMPF